MTVLRILAALVRAYVLDCAVIHLARGLRAVRAYLREA